MIMNLFSATTFFSRNLHTFVRSLRSSNTSLLTVPFARTALAARRFSVASPKIWNSLPPAVHSCNRTDTFCRHPKNHYFQQAFSSLMRLRYLPPCASDSAFADIVRIYKFHLLTYLLNDCRSNFILSIANKDTSHNSDMVIIIFN